MSMPHEQLPAPIEASPDRAQGYINAEWEPARPSPDSIGAIPLQNVVLVGNPPRNGNFNFQERIKLPQTPDAEPISYPQEGARRDAQLHTAADAAVVGDRMARTRQESVENRERIQSETADNMARIRQETDARLARMRQDRHTPGS